MTPRYPGPFAPPVYPLFVTASYAWFPALRFRSSIQIESSSIFPFPLLSGLELRPLGSAGMSPASRATDYSTRR